MASEEVSSTHRQFVLFVDSHEQALLSAQRLRARQVLMNSLERRELVKCHGYIANLAPAKDRARLAQGTLQMLGMDAPVGIGSEMIEPKARRARSSPPRRLQSSKGPVDHQSYSEALCSV